MDSRSSRPLSIGRHTTLLPPQPGDYYPQDGKVDARDYVLWRNAPTSLDGTPTTIQAAYDHWRLNFGNVYPGSGAVVERRTGTGERRVAACLPGHRGGQTPPLSFRQTRGMI